MRIFSFDHTDEHLLDRFIGFPYRHNARLKQFVPPFRAAVRRVLDQDINPFFQYGKARYFLAVRGRRVIGRVAAFVNPKLKVRKAQAGTVGSFEVIDDPLIAAGMLDEALAWLKRQGCGWVYGPMEGTIWAGYRFRIGLFDAPPTFGEPFNQPYYPDFFSKHGFELQRRWFSRLIDLEDAPSANSFARARKIWASNREKAERRGYVFEPVRSDDFDTAFEDIYRITMESFADHLGFTPASFNEFAFRYGGLRRLLEPGQLVVAKKEGRRCGFFVNYWDYARALKAMKGRTDLASMLKLLALRRKETLIQAFIGVMPQEPTGLGSGLFSRAEQEFCRGKAKRVKHPLMSENNRSNTFSSGAAQLTGVFGLFGRSI